MMLPQQSREQSFREGFIKEFRWTFSKKTPAKGRRETAVVRRPTPGDQGGGNQHKTFDMGIPTSASNRVDKL